MYEPSLIIPLVVMTKAQTTNDDVLWTNCYSTWAISVFFLCFGIFWDLSLYVFLMKGLAPGVGKAGEGVDTVTFMDTADSGFSDFLSSGVLKLTHTRP